MNDASANVENLKVDTFIGHWSQSSGAERANFQSFANALCELLGVPLPDPKKEAVAVNTYTFEYDVRFKDADGAESPGRIDLYKKGCFVLEAKQSRLEGRPKAIPGQEDLFSPEDQPQQGRRSANRGWDVLMRMRGARPRNTRKHFHRATAGHRLFSSAMSDTASRSTPIFRVRERTTRSSPTDWVFASTLKTFARRTSANG